MQKINRLLINICTEAGRFQESKDFYTSIFDFTVDYDSDWFIHLISKDKKLELGIIDKNNDVVPEEVRRQPNGFYLTFVVDDVDTIFDVAKSKNFRIVEKPADTFYGQRRLLLEDPNGTLVDISAPIPGFTFG